MPDTIHIRGEEPRRDVTLRSAGWREVRFRQDGVDRTVAGWRVAGIEREDRPENLARGISALEAADFERAEVAFSRLAATDGWEAWGRFYRGQTARQRSALTGRGWTSAVEAYETYLSDHPDDFFEPHARYGLALSAARADDPDRANEVLEPLREDRGPVWALMGVLGRGRIDLETGEARRSLSRFAAVRERAEQTDFGREAGQLATVGVAEARRDLDDAEGAIRALPIIYRDREGRAVSPGTAPSEDDGPEGERGIRGLPIIYTGLPIIYRRSWYGSPAAAPALNVLGEAVRDLRSGPGGAALAVPFHFRVCRYHPNHHVEHARALRRASDALVAAGREEWADEVRSVLEATYPDADAEGGG